MRRLLHRVYDDYLRILCGHINDSYTVARYSPISYFNVLGVNRRIFGVDELPVMYDKVMMVAALRKIPVRCHAIRYDARTRLHEACYFGQQHRAAAIFHPVSYTHLTLPTKRIV